MADEDRVDELLGEERAQEFHAGMTTGQDDRAGPTAPPPPGPAGPMGPPDGAQGPPLPDR